MQKSIIKQAEANHQVALSSQKLADLNFKRAEKLYKSKSASKLNFDQRQDTKNKSYYKK